MTSVTEISPDLYRISTYIPEARLQFNQFVVDDEHPLLFHTGLNVLFPAVREAVANVIDPSRLRWIAFSHYEADECASLDDWLDIAPNAEPLCSLVAKIVSVDDVAKRPARSAAHNEVISTGRQRFRFLQTPHLPHAWDAGLLFEETNRVLLCSDLFHQSGDVEPIAEQDAVLARAREVLKRYQHTVLANYLPYTPYTRRLMTELASLRPRVLATMHGSTFVGDGERAIEDLARILEGVYGQPDVALHSPSGE